MSWVLSLGLSGCGDQTNSDPPRIIAISPDDGSTNVILNTNIVATFDMSMDPMTLEGTSNFSVRKLSDQSLVSGTLAYNESTFTAIFNPEDDLEPETSYQATLTEDIRSNDGVPLIWEYHWTFTTGRLLDDEPPVFSGPLEATAAGSTAVQLTWTAGTDNATSTERLVYLIYRAPLSGSENYTNPTYTTDAGATSYVATGLDAGTTYYFDVRARDEAGNISRTFTQVSAATTPE